MSTEATSRLVINYLTSLTLNHCSFITVRVTHTTNYILITASAAAATQWLGIYTVTTIHHITSVHFKQQTTSAAF